MGAKRGQLANFIIDVINEPAKIDFLRSNLPLPRSPQNLAMELKQVYDQL